MYDIPRPTSVSSPDTVRVVEQIYNVPRPTTLNGTEVTGVAENIYDVPRPVGLTNTSPPPEPSTPNNYVNVDLDLSPSGPQSTGGFPSPQSREHSFYENVTSSEPGSGFSEPPVFTIHSPRTHIRGYSNVSVSSEGELSPSVDITAAPEGNQHANYEQPSRVVRGYEWWDGDQTVFRNS